MKREKEEFMSLRKQKKRERKQSVGEWLQTDLLSEMKENVTDPKCLSFRLENQNWSLFFVCLPML